jgi:glycosyltransferase involved in cell wall biosynthesis
VVIPVGPNKVYKKYLQQCIDSLKVQELPADEIILIDDMAGLEKWNLNLNGLPVRIHKNPWLSGVAHSFNFGVALARNECVVMLGSDDALRPHALIDAARTYGQVNDKMGYYYYEIEYSDTGETQADANNCAMVTKTLWKAVGGFPVQSSIGACDHILLSVIIGNRLAGLYRIWSHKPPYWYRRHGESVTTTMAPELYQAQSLIRDGLTMNYKRPNWGRYDT